MNIKIKYKYYFILPFKNYKILDKNNNLKNLIKNIKNLTKNKKYLEKKLILLKLTKNKVIKSNSKIKITTGPIKVEIISYIINKRGTIKLNENSDINNLLFYTQDYLNKNKINNNDLRKISKAANLNKLEINIFAPKLIDQIKSIKL